LEKRKVFIEKEYNYNMYDIEFSAQIEDFKRHLWGAYCVDTKTAAREASRRYVLPANVKTTPCYKASNGEWVPQTLAPSEGKLEIITETECPKSTLGSDSL